MIPQNIIFVEHFLEKTISKEVFFECAKMMLVNDIILYMLELCATGPIKCKFSSCLESKHSKCNPLCKKMSAIYAVLHVTFTIAAETFCCVENLSPFL